MKKILFVMVFIAGLNCSLKIITSSSNGTPKSLFSAGNGSAKGESPRRLSLMDSLNKAATDVRRLSVSVNTEEGSPEKTAKK